MKKRCQWVFFQVCSKLQPVLLACLLSVTITHLIYTNIVQKVSTWRKCAPIQSKNVLCLFQLQTLIMQMECKQKKIRFANIVPLDFLEFFPKKKPNNVKPEYTQAVTKNKLCKKENLYTNKCYAILGGGGICVLSIDDRHLYRRIGQFWIRIQYITNRTLWTIYKCNRKCMLYL